MNITIRLAVPADIPDMVEVGMRSCEVVLKDFAAEEYICKAKATYPDTFNRIITDNNTTHYIIHADDKAIGMAIITPPSDEDISDNFYEFRGLYLIHPDYYQQGIGTKVMDFIFDIVLNLGKTAMILWVVEKNKIFTELYEKCGFAADGKTKIFDAGEILNCIRMRRDL